MEPLQSEMEVILNDDRVCNITAETTAELLPTGELASVENAIGGSSSPLQQPTIREVDPAVSHSYMPPTEREYRSTGDYDHGTEIVLPVHIIPTGVCIFPGETVPLRLRDHEHRQRAFLQRLLASSGSGSPLLGAIAGARHHQQHTTMGCFAYGTTIEVRSASGVYDGDRAEGLALLATARQRFKLLSVELKEGVPHALVRILTRDELPPLPPEVLQSMPPTSSSASSSASESMSSLCYYPSWVWRMQDCDTIADSVWGRAVECNLVSAAHRKRAADGHRRSGSRDKRDRSGSGGTADAIVETSGAKALHGAPADAGVASGQMTTQVRHTSTSVAADQQQQSSKPEHPWQAVATDPSSFSFWVARNLPVSPLDKNLLLSCPSAYARLKKELELLQKVSIFACARCDAEITTKEHIVGMSETGERARVCDYVCVYVCVRWITSA